MDIRTQEFLNGLDTHKRDGGLTVRELKTLDRNGDGQISAAETGNRVSQRDLNLINQRLNLQQQAKNLFAFVDDNQVLFTRAELNTALFPGGVQGISASDIDQGGLGSCYLLAAAAGLAAQRPEAIIRMIQDNGNGTFTVRFPGISKPVTVSRPTAEELNKYASRGANGSIWVAVIEKAYAQHTNNSRWFPKADSYEAVSGGFLSSGIHPLTGNSTNTDTLALTAKSTTRSRLQSALRNKRVVTASVNSLAASLWGNDKKASQQGLPANHVYTILSYDRASDTLRVRNPWGVGSDAKGLRHNDGNNDGVFTLTMDEFYRYFSFIGYEEGH